MDEDSSIGVGLEVRERMTWIGHRGRRYWNPISDAGVDAWVAGLPLGSADHVLDVGCGSGALLLAAARAHDCHVLGIDPLAPAIAAAQEAAEALDLGARAEFREQRFEDAELPGASFELISCLGASHAFDGWRGAFDALPPLLAPGGHLLLGEGYWVRPPDEGYLDFLGCEEDVYLSHQGNLAHAEARGFEVVRAHCADDAEWVAYEDSYAANLHGFLAEHPEDPDADAIHTRITAWRDAYLEWGVDTLGFGLYLLRRAD